MIAKLFDVLFGCWHERYSFPITSKSTQRRSSAASLTGTYVVCLDCGREFPYDWQEMKVLSTSDRRQRGVSKAAESYAAK
jgi:hypothetical protein